MSTNLSEKELNPRDPNSYNKLFMLQRFGPGQQCCYGKDGTINTGTNGGTADLIAPTNWKTIPLHFLVDVVPWFLCCTGLFKDCSKYTSRRPVDDCSEWPERPPPGVHVLIKLGCI